jgi:Domain of unknown function (DUF4431)
MRRWLAGVIVALIGAQAAQADCLKAETDDQVARGKLTYVRIEDEAYERVEHAYILELKEPACLDGTDEIDKIEKTNRIHVFAVEKPLFERLRRFIGKRVEVRGNAFGEHTAHHHAPIVMKISKIDPL